MSKPTFMKKVSQLLVTVLLISVLMPVIALGATDLFRNPTYDGQNVGGTVYSSTYHPGGVTVSIYNPNGDLIGVASTVYVSGSVYEWSINSQSVTLASYSYVTLQAPGVNTAVYTAVYEKTAPTWDQNPLTGSTTYNSVTFNWNAANDSSSVTYEVYKVENSSETRITNTSALTYTDSNLQPASMYSYRVYAVDAYGNKNSTPKSGAFTTSAASATLSSITTDIPTTLTVGDSHNTVVKAVYSDDTKIDVTANAAYSSSDESKVTVSSAGVVKAVAAGSADIKITYGGKEANVSVTVTAKPIVDTKPKWGDSTLTVNNITVDSMTLTLSKAATSFDGSSVSYEVYQGTSTTPSYTTAALTQKVTGLAANTSYTFSVVAVDAHGHRSDAKTVAEKTRAYSGGGGFGGPGGSTGNTTNSDGSINVTNGQVDSSTLKNAFANKTEVTLVVKGDTATIPVSALLDAAKKSGSALVIKTDNGTYVLPLSLFDFDALAKDLGVAVGDLKFTVNIKKLAGNDAKSVTDGVTAAGGTSLSEAVDFSITFEGKDGKKQSIDSFKQYVKRTIPLKSKPGKNAVVLMYDPATKTFSFVPGTFSDTEATFLRTGNSVYTVVEYSKTFSDIATHWAKADIELLASKMIVNGATDTAFQADRNITRAEFAALVVRSLGLTPVASAAKFSDVKSADWYAGAVGAAVQAGIVNGYEDGSFRPQAQITREELAAMVVRAYEFAGGKVAIDQASITKALSKYSDAGKIVWGQKEVAIALSAGLMNGLTDTTLETDGQATRAQAATMLKRFLSNLKFI